MDEKAAKESQEFDNIVGGICLFIICSLLIFTVYCSARYEYYVNDELSLLKHDRYKDKVCVIDIDKKAYPKRADFFWKLCFRYRYLKNNEKHSLIRIDKFKQTAIYLIDANKKFGFVEDDPLEIRKIAKNKVKQLESGTTKRGVNYQTLPEGFEIEYIPNGLPENYTIINKKDLEKEMRKRKLAF